MSLPPGSMSMASRRDLHSNCMLHARADFVKPENPFGAVFRAIPASAEFGPAPEWADFPPTQQTRR